MAAALVGTHTKKDNAMVIGRPTRTCKMRQMVCMCEFATCKTRHIKQLNDAARAKTVIKCRELLLVWANAEW